MNKSTQKVPLSQLEGLHQHSRKMARKHSGIPPYACSVSLELDPSFFDSILELSPIVIKTINEKRYVVGNIRTYQMAKQLLPADFMMTVKEISSRRTAEIERLFWAEFLFKPIIENHSKSWHQWLYANFVQFNNHFTELWDNTVFKGNTDKKTFASMINIDPRSLK